MNFEHDPQADAVYVNLSAKRYAYGKDLDNQRRIDYDTDDIPVGIELLNVSSGVNVSGLPHEQEIRELLESKGIKTYILKDQSQIGTAYADATVLLVLWGNKETVRIIEPVETRPTVNFVPLEQVVTK